MIVSEPAQLALSLDEARIAARLDGTALDAEIETLVRSITAHVEHETGRAIINQTHRITLDQFGGAIRLPASPVQSVVVKYLDADGAEQTLDPQDYLLDNARPECYIVPAPGKAWPATYARINAVTVDAVCGYGPDHTTTPPSVKAYIIGRLSEHYQGKAPSPYLERNLWPLKVWA